jgi:hypothetical protein
MAGCRFEVHHRTLGACSVSTTGPSPAIWMVKAFKPGSIGCAV